MLRCVSRYRSSLGAFAPGDLIDAPELCAALLADSPGSFEDAAPADAVAAIEEAPEHRAVTRRRGK